MKNWARWTLLIIWTLGLILTAQFWNPFASFPALLKYTVVVTMGAALFGLFIILMQFWVLVNIVFPLPPRADAKAPKPFGKRFFPFLYKEPPINPRAPQTLDELIGQERARIEIKEVIDILQDSSRYEDSGAEVPKGMLFVGPPGVGKTLFARAIANEIGVPFYVVDGGSFSGVIFGLGVLKLKMLFSKLRGHEKSILFIDEIESMGSRREQDRGFGAQSDMNMTLNTLLTEMDGFRSSNMMVIGATNNDGMLDPALMRAGRMSRRIYFQLPTEEERGELFRYYLGKVACDPELDYKEMVAMTANYSPADIANVVNEAALLSRRPGGPNRVTMQTIKDAMDNIAIGLERSLTSGVELITHDPSIRLDDVVGIDDCKQDIQELIDFLKRGEELKSIGAKLPKGVMMVGPPGVGKTMLAKAIANEAGVPFYGVSATFFQSMWRGEGAGRIRNLYSQARKSPAAIVFIDEIDALGGTMTDSGSRRTQELNQILIELDGIGGHANVITIGATNIEDSLDPAFMRSGRFDRKIYFGLPDKDARKVLFERYLKKVKVEEDINFEELSKVSFNFSGADVAACVNEAAIQAVRNGRKKINFDDLEEATRRIAVDAGHKLNTAGMNLSKVPDLNVKLNDVKGMDEAKAEAEEVVALLKNADLVQKSGLKSPHGVLLVGPPGTGKTMLAKAIANEAGVAFYALSGTDFVQMWVGLGAKRVRAVYEQARRSGKPAIVFIDEIDAVGGHRVRDRGFGGQTEHNNTLNQLLVEMDGFGRHKVLTIGATNNPQALDKALLRAGRFDRRIDVPLPNLEGREAILNHHIKELTLDTTVNLLEIARMTVFNSGADLANIINEAGLIAVRHGRLKLNQVDLIQAIQRVHFGMHRSQNIVLEDLWATAYHEAGHTIVSFLRNRMDRIQVVTIIPSGNALGYMWSVAKDDYFHHSKGKTELLTDIEVSLGGMVAERLHKGENTQGVSSDLENVARVARGMVRRFGMGSFPLSTEKAFGEWNEDKASPETELRIETETMEIVQDCMKTVEGLLSSRRKELDQLAAALVEKETLYYRDIVSILEPTMTDSQIEEEIKALSERKLVGKKPAINMDFLSSLATIAQGRGGKGSDGSGGGNGGNGGNGGGSSDSDPASGASNNRALPVSDTDTDPGSSAGPASLSDGGGDS